MTWRELNSPMGWVMIVVMVGMIAGNIYSIATTGSPISAPCIRWEYCD
jgi:hypothetical protein